MVISRLPPTTIEPDAPLIATDDLTRITLQQFQFYVSLFPERGWPGFIAQLEQTLAEKTREANALTVKLAALQQDVRNQR